MNKENASKLRKITQEAGYKNGDPLGGKMFPVLYE